MKVDLSIASLGEMIKPTFALLFFQCAKIGFSVAAKTVSKTKIQFDTLLQHRDVTSWWIWTKPRERRVANNLPTSVISEHSRSRSAGTAAINGSECCEGCPSVLTHGGACVYLIFNYRMIYTTQR